MDILVTGIVSFIFAFVASTSFNKSFLSQNVQKPTPAPVSAPDVLGETTTAVDTITFDVDAVFNKPLTINSGVTFDGTSVFSKTIKGVSIDLGGGSLTAGNVLYSIKPGSGIGVSTDDPQHPTISNTGVLSLGGQTGSVSLSGGSGISISGTTITNTGILSLAAGGGISVSGTTITNDDPGSAQKIFKTISVSGQNDIIAGTNIDILTFASGPGVAVTTNGLTKTLTIASSNPGVAAGWTYASGGISLTNANDSVGIGTTSPNAKLDVIGNAIISGGLNLVGSGLTNAGAITGATGFTSTGTITFGSMSTGIIHGNASGVLSSSPVDLTDGDVSGLLPLSRGGTGLSIFNPGDLLFASSSSTLARLGLGGDGQVLVVNGTNLAWGAVPSASGPCPSCLINNPGSNQIITPSQGTATGLVIKQANGGIVDVFKITDYSGDTSYLRVDSNGNVTLGNGQTTAGVLTVNPINTDPISISPSAQGAHAFTGMITTSDLTAARTWTFPDQSGIVCTTSGNCTGTSSSLGGNGASNYLAKWNDTYSLSDSLLFDNGTSVGIGTTSPIAKLDVVGTLRASGATTLASSLSVTGIATLSSTLNVVGSSTLASLGVTGDETVGGTMGITGGTTVGGNLAVNGTGVSSILGNVGIGTTSPTEKLTVAGNVLATGTLYAGSGSYYLGNTGTFKSLDIFDSAGNVGIGTTSPAGLFDVNSKFTVLSGGNVGVGTTAPSASLDIISSASSTNGQNITMSAITSGKGLNITTSGNTLTSGSLLNISSTLTNTTFTGSLANIDWSPSGASQIVNTGDLLRINVGQYGTIGNLLNIMNNGSTLFGVSQTAITANLPTSFTAAGDTSMAYDLAFTNPTLSNIRSASSLSIIGGEAFNSSNITLQTFNNGQLILDAAGGVALNQSQNWNLNTAVNALNFQTATISSLLSFDTNNGRIGIGTTAPGATLDVNGTGNFGSANKAIIGGDGSGTSYVGSRYNNPLAFFINSGEKARFDISGNLGIGTTAPGDKLEVSGNVFANAFNAIGTVARYNSTGGTYLTGNAGSVYGALQSYSDAGGTGRVLALNPNGGFVGIGTTNPLAKLDVNGDIHASGYASVSASLAVGYTGVMGGTGNAAFSGNVGIGTSSPTSALHMVLGTTTQKGIVVQAITGQNASLQEWQNNYGNILTSVQSGGNIYLAGYSSTPAYGTSPLSMGNRIALITITSTVASAGGPVTQLIDGVRGGAGYYFASQTVDSTKWINFDFGSPQIVNEASFYQYNGLSHGIWKWQGSNDNSTFSDIGGSFTLGGVTPFFMTSLNANTTAYRYYRIIGISGNASSAWWQDEFEFSIAPAGGNVSSQSLISSANIGIGTTAPAANLDVRGSAAFSGNVGIGTTAPAGLLDVNGKFTVLSGGNVGIGTISPAGLLDVNGKFTVLSGGNIGIGITNPGANLDILSAATTSNGQNITMSAITSGKGLNITTSGNTLTSGSLLNISSTLTNTTFTGSLANIDWSPSEASQIVNTGDLLRINVGQYGTIGNLLNIMNNGSTLFGVSQTAITANLPTSFTAAGDVALAYDLNFTNTTISNITSKSSLSLIAGPNYASSNLSLVTYNAGQIVLDSPGGMVLNQSQNWFLNTAVNALNIQTATLSSLMSFDTNNARVGIGTTAPGYAFEVNGDIKASSLRPVNVYGYSGGVIAGFNTLTMGNGISSFAGNVGIGTTAPGYQLDVNGTVNGSNIRGTSFTVANVMGSVISSGAIGNLLGLSIGSGYAGTVSPPTNGAIIAGNVGIGTTNPLAALEIVGGFKASSYATIGASLALGYTNAPAGMGNAIFSGNVGIGSSSPGYKLQVGEAGDGTEARANAWNSLSDSRFKDNITPISNALAKITLLNGVSFNWKSNGKATLGLVAQNVQTVFPELVSTDANGVLSLNYDGLSGPIIQAIKEQQTQIDKIQAQSTNTPSSTPSIDLKVLGALEADGAVTFKSTVDVAGQATFRALVEFFDTVVFHGRATFEKAPLFSGNTAGSAIISELSDEVHVTFDQKYDAAPIVTFTMVNEATDSSFLEDGQKAYLTKVTNEGFTIKIPVLAMRDYSYNWMAIATNSTKVTKSTSLLKGLIEQVAGVATPSASLSPTPIASSSAGM